MRVAVFGGGNDAITQAYLATLAGLGDEGILIDYAALDEQVPVSLVDGAYHYAGEPVGPLDAAILRFIPQPSVPFLRKEGRLELYDDWHTAYMNAGERSFLYMGWLLDLHHAGIPLVNPPHAASVQQFKSFQLQSIRRLGGKVPRTLISNDPDAVRAFQREVGDVIFKPLIGGALARRLDAAAMEQLELIRNAPVTFQELVPGEDVRITLVGREAVSAVAVDIPEGTLDYRSDPTYAQQGGSYREVQVPESVLALCRRAMEACHLEFAGIDLRHDSDDWVFLELNSSPVYFDVERKMGHPVTRTLVQYVRDRALRRQRG